MVKKNQKNHNQSLLTFLGIVSAGLVVVQILVFIFFSTQSGALSQISQEKEKLILENHRLEKEINQSTSLASLEEKARKAGFTTPVKNNSYSSVIYLAKQLPVAIAN